MLIYFDGVPVERLEVLDEAFVNHFKRIAEDGIDMERMSKIIEDAVQAVSDL